MDIEPIYLFVGLIAIIIQCLLLAWVISSATQTKTKIFHAEVSNRLLILIAKKLNATQAEIDEAVKR